MGCEEAAGFKYLVVRSNSGLREKVIKMSGNYL
jgi:hypothetical protein